MFIRGKAMRSESTRCESPGIESGFVRRAKQFWGVVREMVGDDAYERYCAHHRSHHAHGELLDRQAFYLKNQQEKWNGIKRCC